MSHNESAGGGDARNDGGVTVTSEYNADSDNSTVSYRIQDDSINPPDHHTHLVGNTYRGPADDMSYEQLAGQNAIEIIEDIGTDTIQSHINMLTTRASANIPSDRLVSPSNPESGLVTVHVENPQTVVDRLNAEHDIVVRTLPDPADSIRASLHVYNTREDVDALLSGLQSTVDGW